MQADTLGSIRRAAIRATVGMNHEPAEVFAALAGMIARGDQVIASAQGLRVLPRTSQTLVRSATPIETATGLLNADCSVMPVIVFTTDHRATTIDRVVQAVEAYDRAHADSPLKFRLATGNVGVMAATNQAVRKAEIPMLIYVYLTVIAFCAITFRSLVGTLATVLPLILVSILCNALMAQLGIGLKISTLPAAALGVERVVLTREAASPWHPKALRAGGTAAFRLELRRAGPLAELATVQPLLALSAEGTPIDLAAQGAGKADKPTIASLALRAGAKGIQIRPKSGVFKEFKELDLHGVTIRRGGAFDFEQNATMLLKDVVFRIAPMSDLDARGMTQGIRGAALLEGYRGMPAADRGAIEEVLLRVQQLALDLPEVAEMELNPLKALPPGRGSVALDARVRIRPRG